MKVETLINHELFKNKLMFEINSKDGKIFSLEKLYLIKKKPSVFHMSKLTRRTSYLFQHCSVCIVCSIINEPVFPADQQEKINAFSEVTIVTFMKYRSFILSTQGCSYLNQSVLFGNLAISSHI